MNRNRLAVCIRGLSAAALLVLLGVCGFVGAGQTRTNAVSVPVVRLDTEKQEYASSTLEQIKERLGKSRNEEIALLDSVIADENASEENRQNALAQKTEIAACMETQARVEAALSYMGYDQIAALCLSDRITLFVPFSLLAEEQQQVRLIDAAATASGTLPEEIKIILVKK